MCFFTRVVTQIALLCFIAAIAALWYTYYCHGVEFTALQTKPNLLDIPTCPPLIFPPYLHTWPTHLTNPHDLPTWPDMPTWPDLPTCPTHLPLQFAILVTNIQQQQIRNYNWWCTIHLLPPLWLGMGSGVLFVLFMCFWTHQTGATVSMSLMEVFWTQTHRKCFV